MAKKMRLGLIGCGTMGKGILQTLAQSDVVSSIVWKGRTMEAAQCALSELKAQWQKLIEKKIFQTIDVDIFLEKISVTNSFDDFATMDCVLEAVSENMASKRDVFLNLANVLNGETILATNTSSLSITELSYLTQYPENVIGMHFFNPAPIMKLTEIIEGYLTAQSTKEWALNFAQSLGKSPVVVKEAPGFIVNRMLIPMINEAICILAEGIASAKEIDKAMCLGANHPIGPLALADLIGNDVNLSIMETLHAETGDPKYRAHPLLRKMVRANLLGRKTNGGFYKY